MQNTSSSSSERARGSTVGGMAVASWPVTLCTWKTTPHCSSSSSSSSFSLLSSPSLSSLSFCLRHQATSLSSLSLLLLLSFLSLPLFSCIKPPSFPGGALYVVFTLTTSFCLSSRRRLYNFLFSRPSTLTLSSVCVLCCDGFWNLKYVCITAAIITENRLRHDTCNIQKQTRGFWCNYTYFQGAEPEFWSICSISFMWFWSTSFKNIYILISFFFKFCFLFFCCFYKSCFGFFCKNLSTTF